MSKIFATLNGVMNPVELHRGQPNNLFWQLVTNTYEAQLHNLPTGQYARVNNLIPDAAFDVYSADDFARLRIQSIDLPTVPDGKVMTYTLAVDSNNIISVNPTFTDAPVIVPTLVSRMQLKRQMLQMARTDSGSGTLLDQTNELITGLNNPDITLYWTDSSEFHRDHPKVAMIGAALNLTSDQVDAAFISAALLT